MNHGRLAGTGKFVILPVDQGFEHGPGRSFEPNPAGYDPRYHAELAVKSGCNAYAAPLGAIEAAHDVIEKHKLPLILKVNNHDGMMPDDADPKMAVTSWVEDAVRLNANAVGFTIYPASAHAQAMYLELKQLVADARKAGLPVVVWTYPRGSGLESKDVETAVDVVAYAVHIAAQLGAHIIKCKPPKAALGLPDHIKREVYKNTPIQNLSDRIKIIIQAAFNGRRIVINSGGDAKGTDELLEEIRQLHAGGSFGSIVGRNSFQRPETEAIKLLNDIQDIYAA
jgi:class I fructose-bisphosphate aldolase